MKYVLIALLSFPALSYSQDTLKVWSKYDFVSGDKIIFEDNFAGEKNGEFPSRWKLKAGNAENAVHNGENVLSFAKQNTEVMPRMNNENYLPDVFTIEFDGFYYNKYNEAYTIKLGGGKSVYVRTTKSSLGSAEGSPSKSNQGPGWHHIALSYNKGALKVYFDHDRVLNIPDLEFVPKNFSIQAVSGGAIKSDPSIIKNVRVAEGGVPLYDRLTTQGKIITSGILFDSGKSTIKPESMGTLNEIAKMMKDHPELKLSVEGHTDSDGEDGTNLQLSKDRAEAVKKALVDLGIEASRLTTNGFGESKPLNENKSAEDKANNRRVEFVKE